MKDFRKKLSDYLFVNFSIELTTKQFTEILAIIRGGHFEAEVIRKNAEGLLPCPFCGSDKVELNEAILNMKPAWIVECMVCYASPSSAYIKKEAVNIWNTRK